MSQEIGQGKVRGRHSKIFLTSISITMQNSVAASCFSQSVRACRMSQKISGTLGPVIRNEGG